MFRFALIAAIFAIAFPLPARAAVIDFSTELVQLNGKPFTLPADDLSDSEKAIVATLQARGYSITKPTKTTLGDVSIQALLTPIQSEDPKDKLRKFTLAQKIEDADEDKLQQKSKLNLTVDEITLLKDAIGKNYPPLIMGQCWKILDPASFAAK